MPYLEYSEHDGKKTYVDLAREVTVGRQPGCDLIISKKFVSRKHARIFQANGKWRVADLGSSHGTYVNRQRVQEHTLSPGDEVLIGEDVILFRDGKAPKAAAGRTAPSAPAEAPEVTGKEVIPPEMILREADVQAGELMQAILAARKSDVADLSRSPPEGAPPPSKLVMQPLPSTIANALDRKSPSPPPPPRSEAEVTGHLLALVKIADEMRRCADIEQVCKVAVDMALKATGGMRGVIALKDDKGEWVMHAKVSAKGKGGDDMAISQSFVEKVVSQKVACIARNTDLDRVLSTRESVVSAGIRSILGAPLWSGDEILGYIYLDIIGMLREFRDADLDLVSAIGHHAAAEIVRLRLVERIRDEETQRRDMQRFVSSDVVRLLEQERKAGKGDQWKSAREQEVSVLFADIAGFTRISERLDPGDVKRFLDDYLDYMTEVVIDKHGGTLDKYMGDAIMALFGAPFSQGVKPDAIKAVSAAVAMRDTLEVLRATRKNYADVKIRIGINTGRVIAGWIGSRRRIEYSVIGDTVNVASRLESSGEPGRILIGEKTYESVQSDFDCEYAGERQLRNREKPVKCWWVSGPKL